MPAVDSRFARRYQSPSGNPFGVLRPMLGVRLVDGETVTPRILALLDSGADGSTFHVDVARLLGVDTAGCQSRRVLGVGGAVSVLVCPIELEIEGRRFAADVNFVTDPSPRSLALLGRQDVFEQFRIGFDQRNLTVLLEPYEQ